MGSKPNPLPKPPRLVSKTQTSRKPVLARVPRIHADLRRHGPHRVQSSGAEGRVFESRRARVWVWLG